MYVCINHIISIPNQQLAASWRDTCAATRLENSDFARGWSKNGDFEATLIDATKVENSDSARGWSKNGDFEATSIDTTRLEHGDFARCGSEDYEAT